MMDLVTHLSKVFEQAFKALSFKCLFEYLRQVRSENHHGRFRQLTLETSGNG